MDSAKLSFIIEGEIKNFHDKQRLKEFTTKPKLQKILKGILHTEDKHNHENIRKDNHIR
jgi:hypothetical protein